MIPVGFLRVLVTMTSPTWDPDPFCGEAVGEDGWSTSCRGCSGLLDWLMKRAGR